MNYRGIKLKKIISYMLLFCLLLNGLAFNMSISYAQSRGKVTITNVYTNFRRTEKRITIDDESIKDYENKKLKVQTHDDEWHEPRNINLVGQSIIQAELDPQLIIMEALVWGRILDGDPPVYKDVETRYSNINEKGIPEILNVNESIVKINEPIILNGKDNIKELKDSKYTITVGGVEADVKEVVGKNQVELYPKAGQGQFPGGVRDIVIRSTDTSGEYDLGTTSVYKNAIRITGELGIEGVTMFPTMGEPGSKVTFRRSTFPSQEGYDIYFIKDIDNPEFTEENMAKNQSISLPHDNTKETVITVEVPNLGSSPYYVVFANKESQKYGIDSTYVLPQQYQVVTISQKPTIDSVQPNRAPAMTPTLVEINGNFFTKHNIPGFNPNENLISDNIDIGDKVININYGSGELELPDETGKPVKHDVNVERKIEVDIGRVLGIEGFDYNLSDNRDPNTFVVKTENVPLTEAQVEDVIIRVTTNIIGTTEGGFSAEMVQEFTVRNGFTYYPATEIPNIKEVVPNVIPIEEIDGSFYLDSSMGRLLLSIEGENFLVTRYIDENGVERMNFPKITIGGVVINPNENKAEGEHKPLKYEVLNNGIVVDGTLGNEIGNRILIELKAGKEGFKLINKDSRNVNISNPNRQSKDFATEWIFEDKVRFELINKNDFPVIDNVRPSLVSIDGGEDVTVTGSNFRPGARVYIENRLVPSVNISGDGKVITFKAPAGSRPGETLLQVINPEGGIATHVFTYTQTYTEPKLTYINPKEGTTNTLVTVKGENFLAPDPTIVISNIENVDEFLIYRLIGTRIFMDGHDINEYNKGEQNRIKLEQFAVGKIFSYDSTDKKITLGESYDSTILYDETNNKFYSIVRDVRNDYYIEGGEGIRYKISYVDGNFKANDYDIDMTEDGILKFNGLELKAYTPFKIQGNKIIGNRVQFIDSNTLTFKVPNLNMSPWTGEGRYDVSVVNPDTKKQTIKDGFYFYASSSTRPVIVDVIPDRGPEKGGNIIHIIGPEPDPEDEHNDRIGFVDTGVTKTQVFIGGQKVPDGDVTILPGGRMMEVKVPPTIENIKEKGTDRITVSLVLVNPDGGTFSISYENPLEVDRQRGEDTIKKTIRGYTYIVPTSNPRITEIHPREGSAAGGYILEIFGSDFRDFEPFVDLDGNGEYSEGEPYDDIDGNGRYTRKAPDTRAKSKYNPEYEYLTSPILPKVYFGNKESEIVEFGTGYLQVIVPPNDPGPVDLYVVNNDSGISNKVRFNYLSSDPRINSVVPNVGNVRGGEKVDIHGENLENNKITLVKKDNTNNSIKEVKHMPLVRFGNNLNEDLPREHSNSGVIRSNRTRVKLDGGIEITYDALGKTVTVTLEENEIKYTNTYEDYNGEEIFINTKDLKNGDENYPYEQLIRLVVANNRLLVSGNYAPNSQFRNNTHVVITTPAYYKIGRTPIFIINPDKGKGEGEFEYKYPDSNPKITNITKEGDQEPILEDREEINGKAKVLKVDYKGGNRVTIHGTDFRENAIIKIADLLTITEKDIEYRLPNELTFTMPSVPAGEANKLHRVVVENKDGGTASSDRNDPPIYIEFVVGESNPEVYTIEPDKGPATGGTKIKITGADFRKEMEKHPNGKLKVYFGDAKVDDNNITFIDYKTLEVIAPPSNTLGPVQVRIENPDGSMSQGDIRFTYISKPRIDDINPKKLFTNDTETEVTITGSQFMSGAKVIVGGKIIPIRDLKSGMDVKGQGITGVDPQGNNREVAVIDGMEATSVNVVSNNQIKVRFNQATDLENSSIIIINPDGGISDPYNDFKYEKPVPLKPMVLEAIPGYESTVMLIWNESDPDLLNKATKYEIYGRKATESTNTFIGTTTDAEYLIKGLEPDTEYIFLVRALNEHGAALDFAEVKVRTLSLQEDYKQREKEERLKEEQKKLIEKGKEEIIGNKVIKTLGSEDIKNKVGNLDFNQSKYKNTTELVINIPLALARTDSTLNIKYGELQMTINPKDLYTYRVSSADKGDKDSNLQVHIKRQGESHIPRGKKIASRAYDFHFGFQSGKENMDIDKLLRSGKLTLNLDTITYNNAKNVALYKFDIPTGKYVKISNNRTTSFNSKGKYILLSDR
ncbi:IPT/TIG domain-containing protein [Schnuerera ultunensis]|uniref:Putative Fibronectin, type III domain protein n=1 Tax=[Clostridium] ultunense Esp TaxID=1288971 RepID=A0A1M4PLA4_9FIRM|nr:IPT/TIG domain-containing protein [Schnuerera ultunensis]SHD76224.1 putative Fibronectin, type III domain protein [[Clostridium] ultunense Esp]